MIKALKQTLTNSFLLQNNLCEFDTHTYKSKRFFNTQKHWFQIFLIDIYQPQIWYEEFN